MTTLEELLPIISTAIGAMFTALTGAVIALWKMQVKRAESCEKKHEDAQQSLLLLTGDVGKLKGKVEIAEQIKPSIDSLAAEVVSEFTKGKEVGETITKAVENGLPKS